MTREALNSLTLGLGIRVRFGAKGSQYAVIDHHTRAGNTYVRKWSAKGQRYTKPVRLYPQDFLGVCTPDETCGNSRLRSKG